MPKRVVTEYSEEFKAKVLADYQLGASVFSLERKYGVTSDTIDKWALHAGISRSSKHRPIEEDDREEMGRLVKDYMRASLRALHAIAEHTQDKEWLMQQSAEGTALIFSTIHDKTVHLLSSMQANAEAAKELLEQQKTLDGNHLLPGHPDYVDPSTLQPINQPVYTIDDDAEQT